MTGYSPQFSNISAKSNEIKNAKKIIIWPFYWYFKQRPIYLLKIPNKNYIRALLIFAHPSARKKAIFAHF